MSMLDAYNYSLLSVPAMWLLGIGTHFSAIALTSRSKELPKFDNVAPRQFMAEVSKLTKTSADARRYLRMEAAQQNIFENLGLYAAAIVAGNVAGLPVRHMNKIAAGYIASRVVYVFLYSRTDKEKATPLRSLAFITSVVLALGTFVRASFAANKALGF
ncbi:hypothetical protein JCM8202_006216 [Rhodotorula sphaerocarpa]